MAFTDDQLNQLAADLYAAAHDIDPADLETHDFREAADKLGPLLRAAFDSPEAIPQEVIDFINERPTYRAQRQEDDSPSWLRWAGETGARRQLAHELRMTVPRLPGETTRPCDPTPPEWVRAGADVLMVRTSGAKGPEKVTICQVRETDGGYLAVEVLLPDYYRNATIGFDSDGSRPLTRGGRTLAPPFEPGTTEYQDWLAHLPDPEQAERDLQKVASERWAQRRR